MIKWSIRNCIYLLMISIMLTKCSDFFQEDLSSVQISVVVPADSMIVAGPVVSFWWEEVSFCDGYDFQLVSPDFQRPEKMIADTVLYKNRISLNLNPGVYSWRIRAYNQSSASAFREQILFVAEF